ncbi:hypothetical protein BGX27_004996 [Mortierella sp. AM989]|nr:hypothetical protein BGX27_004996 [Mortierella sp. AM989]
MTQSNRSMPISKDLQNTPDGTVTSTESTHHHRLKQCGINNNLDRQSQEKSPSHSSHHPESQFQEAQSSGSLLRARGSGVSSSVHSVRSPPPSILSRQVENEPNSVIQKKAIVLRRLKSIIDGSHSIERGYRVLPLLVGCAVPVGKTSVVPLNNRLDISILVNVPSTTSDWVWETSYNQTTNEWVEVKNVPISKCINAMSIAALIMAVICYGCILLRFLERHVWHSIIISIITAMLQDIFCLAAIVPFCIIYPTSKGYIYKQGFWTMIASTILSFFSTTIMSIDLHRTPSLQLQDSGLTPKQRILVAAAMSLCFYLAFGALIFILIENWTFLDSLYFAMVTITTIGFGDIYPKTAGGRVFVVFYAGCGIVLLAVVVNSIHYVIVEEQHGRFLLQVKARETKRRERRLQHKEQREREMRIRETEATDGNEQESSSPQKSQEDQRPHIIRVLANRNRLELPNVFKPRSDAEAGGMETHDSEPTLALKDHPRNYGAEKSPEETGPISSEVIRQHEESRITLQDPHYPTNHDSDEAIGEGGMPHSPTVRPYSHHKVNIIRSLWRWIISTKLKRTEKPTRKETAPTKANLKFTEKEQRENEAKQIYNEYTREYRIRLQITAATFLMFCIVGALIFMGVESWGFGTSVYFIVITFTTIGYGDVSPQTEAGKIIFLIYVLLGVASLTWLASLISEGFNKVMRKYVVRTQLERERRIRAQERSNDDSKLEEGYPPEPTSEDEFQTSQSLASGSVMDGQIEPMIDVDTCLGRFHHIIRISKELDQVLQKMLGVYHPLSKSDPPSSPSLLSLNKLVSYLEKEEDESMGLIGPSLVRDIATAKSVQVKYSQSNSRATKDNSKTSSSEEPSPPATRSSSSHVHHHRHHNYHNKDGTVTVTEDQWNQMIEYSKQFVTFTEACESALEKLTVWEADEKHRRLEQHQVYLRNKQFFNHRRQQLHEYEATHGLIDNDVELELELLDELDDDESMDEKEGEAMEHRRASIVHEFLRDSRSTSRPSSLHQSSHRPPSPQIDRSEDTLHIDQGNAARPSLLREALKSNPNRLHPIPLMMYLKSHSRRAKIQSRASRTRALGRSMREVEQRLEGRDPESSCSIPQVAASQPATVEQPVGEARQDNEPGPILDPKLRSGTI